MIRSQDWYIALTFAILGRYFRSASWKFLIPKPIWYFVVNIKKIYLNYPIPPFPNAKGQEIQDTVSAKAWGEWLELQTMLINEKHLSMVDKAAKKFINEQRELFLDNGDYERPAGFKPQEN